MPYQVRLETYEGPLDLLLDLISKSKINIEDISIADITQQYLDYIDQMHKFDIEVASEFLVMAATLLYIKSCTLVPKEKPEIEEDGAKLEQELIQRLIEYKKYKEISEKLEKREDVYNGIYYKLPEELVETVDETNLFVDITPQQLLEAFIKVLSEKRIEKKNIFIHRIKRDSISIKERIEQLKTILDEHHETSLFQLFDELYDRSDIIITFLALLELLKENFIQLYQSRPFDDINIKRKRSLGNG